MIQVAITFCKDVLIATLDLKSMLNNQKPFKEAGCIHHNIEGCYITKSHIVIAFKSIMWDNSYKQRQMVFSRDGKYLNSFDIYSMVKCDEDGASLFCPNDQIYFCFITDFGRQWNLQAIHLREDGKVSFGEKVTYPLLPESVSIVETTVQFGIFHIEIYIYKAKYNSIHKIWLYYPEDDEFILVVDKRRNLDGREMLVSNEFLMKIKPDGNINLTHVKNGREFRLSYGTSRAGRKIWPPFWATHRNFLVFISSCPARTKACLHLVDIDKERALQYSLRQEAFVVSYELKSDILWILMKFVSKEREAFHLVFCDLKEFPLKFFKTRQEFALISDHQHEKLPSNFPVIYKRNFPHHFHSHFCLK